MAHDFDTLIDLDGNGAMDLLTTHQELGPSIVQWHTGEDYRYGRSEVLVDALAESS